MLITYPGRTLTVIVVCSVIAKSGVIYSRLPKVESIYKSNSWWKTWNIVLAVCSLIAKGGVNLQE